MRYVIDANIVFAALIKDGPTRELILDRELELLSPPWLWDEVAKRYQWLLQKTGLPPRSLDLLLQSLRGRIQDIPAAAITKYKDKALALAVNSGKKDAPYIAATLAIKGTLWTHDNALASEAPVPAITTRAMAKRYL